MISSILLFVVVLSILVLVHEFGHFVTALWIGAKVEEFGVGFPPRAVSFVRRGIRYSLNWIPLGGFVKIKGESGSDRGDADSFASKPLWKRFVVLSAGVAMNFALAAILLTVGFATGIPHVIEGDLPATAQVSQQAVSVVTVVEGSAAAEAGLLPGDQIVSVDGHMFSVAEDAHAYIEEHIEGSMVVMVERGDDFFSYDITATELAEANGDRVLGIGLLTTGLVSYPWYLAPVKGVVATALFTKEILIAFGQLIGNLIVKQEVSVDLSGPVGIAVLTGEVAKLGFSYLIQFTALLSINLAVINFLPFPALDGGRAFFLLVEKLIGRPVKASIEAVAHNVGFAMLMMLVILVTYRDVVRFGDELLGIFR